MMIRAFRSAVAALCVVSLSPFAVAGPEGDAAADAAALLRSYDSFTAITNKDERKAAGEKFMEECKKFTAAYEGKLTSGQEYLTLGLAYMYSGDREKSAAILESYQKSLVGKPAPSLKVWHVVGQGDGPWSFDDAKGKVVLVDFWATWCPPCRQVIPDLVKKYEAKKADGLVVVGATQIYGNGYLGGKPVRDLDKAAELKLNADFVKEMGITYPIVFCEKNTAMLHYAVLGIPTLVLVDRDGIVQHIQTGAGEHEELDKKLAECLAKKPAGAGF